MADHPDLNSRYVEWSTLGLENGWWNGAYLRIVRKSEHIAINEKGQVVDWLLR